MLTRKDLCLYKDKAFSKSFIVENMGRVDAGQTLQMDGYACNISDHTILNITYLASDSQIRIVGLPTELNSGQWKKVSVIYSPDELRTDDLQATVTLRGKKRVSVN